jgi:branched-chain amino acid transport system substrate-binding protein
MVVLRAALVTPLTGPLRLYGHAGAAALRLWATAPTLPPPWSGVELHVVDAASDPAAAVGAAQATAPHLLFGPYGSSPALAVAGGTRRLLWNHGGATSRLSWPEFPRVVNVLAPASSYFDGVLRLLRSVDPDVRALRVLNGPTGFGRDVAAGAVALGRRLGFDVVAASLSPDSVDLVPEGDVLLVAGDFEAERAAARRLLRRRWRAAAFVGAGVEEVLAPLGPAREGLLGPAQWVGRGESSAAFVAGYRAATGGEPPYPAAQAYAAAEVAARCLAVTGESDDAALLAAARHLTCRTLLGEFRLDPSTGLQVGHQVRVVQWQDGVRRVVWPQEEAEVEVRYPL